jgi:hypothetical protein
MEVNPFDYAQAHLLLFVLQFFCFHAHVILGWCVAYAIDVSMCPIL